MPNRMTYLKKFAQYTTSPMIICKIFVKKNYRSSKILFNYIYFKLAAPKVHKICVLLSFLRPHYELAHCIV
jgi:hypothetical protein